MDSGTAGSQFLYLLTHNIEPMYCPCALLRATYRTGRGELKGEKRRSIGGGAEQRAGVLGRAPQLDPDAELLQRHVRQAKLLQLNDFVHYGGVRMSQH